MPADGGERTVKRRSAHQSRGRFYLLPDFGKKTMIAAQGVRFRRLILANHSRESPLRALYFILGLAAFCAGCCSLNESGRVGSYTADIPKVTVTAGEKLNPLFVQTEDPDYLWESIVDVVDNYFPIPHEYPIQTYKYQVTTARSARRRPKGGSIPIRSSPPGCLSRGKRTRSRASSGPKRPFRRSAAARSFASCRNRGGIRFTSRSITNWKIWRSR